MHDVTVFVVAANDYFPSIVILNLCKLELSPWAYFLYQKFRCLSPFMRNFRVCCWWTTSRRSVEEELKTRVKRPHGRRHRKLVKAIMPSMFAGCCWCLASKSTAFFDVWDSNLGPLKAGMVSPQSIGSNRGLTGDGIKLKDYYYILLESVSILKF